MTTQTPTVERLTAAGYTVEAAKAIASVLGADERGLDDQIADAEAAGDWKLSGRLKTRKQLTIRVDHNGHPIKEIN